MRFFSQHHASELVAESPLGAGPLLSAGLCLAVGLLGGCSLFGKQPPAPPTTVQAPVPGVPARKAISEEASQWLARIDDAIQKLEAAENVWLDVLVERDAARAAAKSLDDALTIKHAKQALSLAQAALNQLNEPPVSWSNKERSRKTTATKGDVR